VNFPVEQMNNSNNLNQCSDCLQSTNQIDIKTGTWICSYTQPDVTQICIFCIFDVKVLHQIMN